MTDTSTIHLTDQTLIPKHSERYRQITVAELQRLVDFEESKIILRRQQKLNQRPSHE